MMKNSRRSRVRQRGMRNVKMRRRRSRGRRRMERRRGICEKGRTEE
jgi:hypothetical protein